MMHELRERIKLAGTRCKFTGSGAKAPGGSLQEFPVPGICGWFEFGV